MEPLTNIEIIKPLNKIAKHLEGIEKALTLLVSQVDTDELTKRAEGMEESTKALAGLHEELVEAVKSFVPNNP